MTIPFHPLANIFPMMSAREQADLVGDMRDNGFRDGEEIVIFEAAILDGRNRYRAARSINIDPPTTLFRGGDPLKFVIAKNLHRRHLKDSQRALIAARLANVPHGGLRVTGNAGRLTQGEACDLLNVRDRSLRNAKVIERSGVADLKHLVEAGNLSVSAAALVARLPAAEQKGVVERGPRAIVAAARKARGARARRGERHDYAALWREVDAICDALERSRLDAAHIAAQRLLRALEAGVQKRRARA